MASVTLPAFVSGIFRVRFWLFLLGALVAGVFWVGMYVGVSYFLGEEVAKRIGAAGTKALFGVILLVAIGLAARAGLVALARAPRGTNRPQPETAERRRAMSLPSSHSTRSATAGTSAQRELRAG